MGNNYAIVSHYEYRKDGKWVRWNEEKDEMKNRFHITNWDVMMGGINHDDVEDWWREVTDNNEARDGK